MSIGPRIIKARHAANFTTLSNECINDERLSTDCLAVLTYVYSKPEDWIVRVSDLRRRFGLGRNKAYEVLNSLIERGYAKRYQLRGEHGEFGEWVTEISDNSIFIKEVDQQPLPGLRDPVNQHYTKETHLQNKDLIEKKEEYKRAIDLPDGRPVCVEQHLEDVEVDTEQAARDVMRAEPTEHLPSRPNGIEVVQCEPFDMFWKIYPRKVKKQQAYLAWQKAILITNSEVIFQAIIDQRREWQLKQDRGIWCRDWPHPASWLNAHEWENEIDPLEQIEAQKPKSFADERKRRESILNQKATSLESIQSFL